MAIKKIVKIWEDSNIVKKNIRLRFYTFALTAIFLYTLNSYLYSLQNVNILINELNICNINNTHLRDNLDVCESFDANNLERGYYVNIFNGELSRRCFYPLKFYNICFNK